MKAATVIRHAGQLRRMAAHAQTCSRVGVARIAGRPLVGDLPEFVFATIGVWAQAEKLEDALTAYIAERRPPHRPPRSNILILHKSTEGGNALTDEEQGAAAAEEEGTAQETQTGNDEGGPSTEGTPPGSPPDSETGGDAAEEPINPAEPEPTS